MNTEYFADFKAEISANIKTTIKGLRRSGTVAMSRRNLMAVTPSPKHSRGPIGTNAQWVYAQMFNEAIDGLPTKTKAFTYEA